MAYDFSNVSAITIPEGSVKKITDSSGNVLWQKVIVIENEPVQKGTLTYTGSNLSPEWYYYDETMMTCTGGNVRTNAGTYFAVFKPNDGYCWSDGSVDPKTIRWTIKKAAGSLSISPTTLTLNSDATSGTITVTRAGDGAISAVSSDTSVATVSVSGNVITVNSVDSTSGSATITISVAAGTNHNAPSSVTCEVTAEFVTYTTMTFRAVELSLGHLVDFRINDVDYSQYLNKDLSGETITVPVGSSVSIYVSSNNNIWSYGFDLDVNFGTSQRYNAAPGEEFSHTLTIPEAVEVAYIEETAGGWIGITATRLL